MEKIKTEELLGPLKRERSELVRVKERLTSELAELDVDLNLIEGAISALSGGTTKRRQSGKRKQPQKPAATKLIVQEQVRAILLVEKDLKPQELKERVAAKIAELGYSQMGFSLRFKEAIAAVEI